MDIVASASSCYFTHVSILRISDCHILQMTLSIPICIAGDDCVEEPDQTSRMIRCNDVVANEVTRIVAC